ncbi:MAG TPA: hypothetical protein VGQ33_00040 [Vicinamibacteria bacterium]|nr:hypothetical protein [Vicinamibacteria bacterium]
MSTRGPAKDTPNPPLPPDQEHEDPMQEPPDQPGSPPSDPSTPPQGDPIPNVPTRLL